MSEENDTYDLGTCCVCEGTENVRNILMLDKRGPVPGRGWGCFVCGLLQDGPSAVVCDDCLEKPLKWACRGYPHVDGRILIEELTEGFYHDYRYHAEEIRWFRDSPDPGHPKCLCSLCGERIEEIDADQPGPIRITKRDQNIEARFHQDCFERVKNVFFEED